MAAMVVVFDPEGEVQITSKLPSLAIDKASVDQVRYR
jgi:hypothetical protein